MCFGLKQQATVKVLKVPHTTHTMSCSTKYGFNKLLVEDSLPWLCKAMPKRFQRSQSADTSGVKVFAEVSQEGEDRMFGARNIFSYTHIILCLYTSFAVSRYVLAYVIFVVRHTHTQVHGLRNLVCTNVAWTEVLPQGVRRCANASCVG